MSESCASILLLLACLLACKGHQTNNTLNQDERERLKIFYFLLISIIITVATNQHILSTGFPRILNSKFTFLMATRYSWNYLKVPLAKVNGKVSFNLLSLLQLKDKTKLTFLSITFST